MEINGFRTPDKIWTSSNPTADYTLYSELHPYLRNVAKRYQTDKQLRNILSNFLQSFSQVLLKISRC